MKQLIVKQPYDYELLDCGNGNRFERFGQRYLIRPDTSCLWRPTVDHWHPIDAEFNEKWQSQNKNDWIISLGKHNNYDLKMTLGFGTSKNIGWFPEMEAHWPWLKEAIQINKKSTPRILNLFGHTGSTTLYLAAHGAAVTHVDASRPAINRAVKNQALSGLDQAPIRWIIDDCLTFMQRELKRHKQYEGIIMDPPAFGRDQKKNIFLFKEQIHALLKLSRELLIPEGGFFILNGYALGTSSQHLYNCVVQELFGDTEHGELVLQDRFGKLLPCSLFVRITR